MNIERAKKLKAGNIVRFPEDRGSPAGVDRVKHVGESVAETVSGTEYVWITTYLNGVWPSNRLG